MKSTITSYLQYNDDLQAIYLAAYDKEYFASPSEDSADDAYDVYFNVSLTKATIDLDAMSTIDPTLTNRQAILADLKFMGFFGYYSYWANWFYGQSGNGVPVSNNLTPGAITNVTKAASKILTDSITTAMGINIGYFPDAYIDENIFRFAVGINYTDGKYFTSVDDIIPCTINIQDFFIKKSLKLTYDPGNQTVESNTTTVDGVAVKYTPPVYGADKLDFSTPTIISDGTTETVSVVVDRVSLAERSAMHTALGAGATYPNIASIVLKYPVTELQALMAADTSLAQVSVDTTKVTGLVNPKSFIEGLFGVDITAVMKDTAELPSQAYIYDYRDINKDVLKLAYIGGSSENNGVISYDLMNNDFFTSVAADYFAAGFITYNENGVEYVDISLNMIMLVSAGAFSDTDPATFTVPIKCSVTGDLNGTKVTIDSEIITKTTIAETDIGRIKVVPEVLNIVADDYTAVTTALNYKYVVEVSEDDVVWTPVYSNVAEHQAVTINLNAYKSKTEALTGVTTTKFNHRYIKIETAASGYVYDCTTGTATLTNGLYLVLKSLQVFNGTALLPYTLNETLSNAGKIDGTAASFTDIATALNSGFSISDIKFSSTGKVVVIIDLGASVAFDKIKIISGEKKDDGSIFGFKYNVSYSNDVTSFTIAGANVDPTTSTSGTITVE